MKRFYVISDYCSIRQDAVEVNNDIVYNGSGADFGKFSNDIYKNFAVNYPKFHKMDNLSKLAFLSAELLLKHKFYGEGNFFISEKFNPSFLVSYVEQLFNTETIQCCIAGWVEIDGNDFESLVFLIEKPDKTDAGIANFEPTTIQDLYDKKK